MGTTETGIRADELGAPLPEGQGVKGVMGQVEKVVADIVTTIAGVQDPALRLVVAAATYDQFAQAAIALGPDGIRGQAAKEALAERGTAKMVALYIKHTFGVDVTTSTINRLAKR